MSTIEQLLKPIFDGGIRSVNFFNGRVLTGEDLSDEQEAQRQARRLIGRAFGEGVASGLEVSEAERGSSPASPIVRIEPGLAVNRRGQTLRLNARTSVGLVRKDDTTTDQTNITFRDCDTLRPYVYVTTANVYLLTLAPAEGREGRAPTAGEGNIPAAFNTRYLVEGVQFRLIGLGSTNLGDLGTLRNRLAYACLGVGVTDAFARDPFNPLNPFSQGYGPLDGLRATGESPGTLTDCEVPLALIYWTPSGGLEFIDMWSVRRRITEPPTGTRWDMLLSDRRRAESEAMILQFQDQIAEMVIKFDLTGATATDYFRYLPPVGILPVRRESVVVGPDGTKKTFLGVNENTFFGNRVVGQPDLIDDTLLRPLLDEALNR